MQRSVCLLIGLTISICVGAQQWNGFKKSLLSNRVQQLSISKDSSSLRRFLVLTTDLQEFEKLLTREKLNSAIKGRFGPTNVMLLELPLTRIRQIFGTSTLVRFIDTRTKPMEETHINGFDRSTNSLNLMRAAYPEYNGRGLSVSIKEQRFDTTDIDFRQRISHSGLETEKTTTHASQMATMIAGGGNSSDFSLGPAWGASLSSSSFE